MLLASLSMAACNGLATREQGTAELADASLASARQSWQEAARLPRSSATARKWLQCASSAYRALESSGDANLPEAQSLANGCTGELVGYLLEQEPSLAWSERRINVSGLPLQIVFRDRPASLPGPVRLVEASRVVIPQVMGQRFQSPGFGIPLVAWAPPCHDQPLCALYPPDGTARSMSAWVEASADGVPRLVIAGVQRHAELAIGNHRLPLAMDYSAAYAALFDRSHLNRLALWNLVGGRELTMREGLYLTEDYDPGKVPLIMLHGLGRSPMVWAKLTNRILGDPVLRSTYQIWHVVYPTNTPVLLNRLYVQRMLDRAWALLDPNGTDPAHRRMLLIGHSMGGVVSRLLVSDSQSLVWNVVFDVPPSQLEGRADDIALMQDIFRFRPYPGIAGTIFLASPHRGSPVADGFIGQMARRFVQPHAAELDALRRVIAANDGHVNPKLKLEYQRMGLSSISTLRASQPVSLATQALMPVPGVRYYTFAGDLPGSDPPGDGIVPLSSAVLPGAVSTIIVKGGHNLYGNDEVVAGILAILRQP